VRRGGDSGKKKSPEKGKRKKKKDTGAGCQKKKKGKNRTKSQKMPSVRNTGGFKRNNSQRSRRLEGQGATWNSEKPEGKTQVENVPQRTRERASS